MRITEKSHIFLVRQNLVRSDRNSDRVYCEVSQTLVNTDYPNSEQQLLFSAYSNCMLSTCQSAF